MILVVSLPLAARADRKPPAPSSVAIVSLEPARTETTLVCTVLTIGLPDPPSRETLLSGLPSSLVLALSLLDPKGRDLGGARAEIRIEPSLWEEEILLRSPAGDLRVSSISGLGEALSQLGPLPVLPLERLAHGVPHRIRARLAVYPLAPSESRRVRELFTGENGRADPDRREVSVGLRSLLRYFLGKPEAEEWLSESFSHAFVREDLPPAEEKEKHP